MKWPRHLLIAVVLTLGYTAAGHAGPPDSVTIDRQLRPPHLDPTRTASASTAEVSHLNVLQGLTRIDRHGKVLPCLATAWRVSDDGRELLLRLRKGVRFHDGNRFDSAVVHYSLNRLLDPEAGNPQRQLYQAIARVETAGPYRVRLHLRYPDSLLPFRLGLAAAVMVHPDSAHSNLTAPIGTGPYRVVPWDGGAVELRRFDGYWGDPPAMKKAVFTFTANRLELENSLSEGRVDLHSDVSPLPIHVQLALRGDYEILKGQSEGEVILAMNHANPALADIRVRRAISLAIDKDELLSIYRGVSPTPIGSHFSPRHPAYVDLTGRYPYDPQRARALLADAGYADGLSLTLRLPPPIYAERGGLHIASNLEAVGIGMTVERLSWGEWLKQVFRDTDYDLTLISHVEPMDIGIYARRDYYFNYDNPDFRALWRHIQRTQESTGRNALLAAAQRMLADDAVNVFLYMKPRHSIHRRGLKGMWRDAPIPAMVVEELYWE